MRILLSNDDGVHAPGLRALYKELKKLGNVWVVAPLEEKSTTGHSLTLHKPLRMIQVDERFFGVSGSPADCVYLGVRQVLGGKLPDLVVSGVNRGANLGQDIYYSGTVSAAREACILGVRSFAVSLAINFKNPPKEKDIHYDTAAKATVKIIRSLASIDVPKYSLVNINVPDRVYSKLKGVKIAHQGFVHYSGSILRRKDHRGRNYYWVGGSYKGFHRKDGTDCSLVDQGYVSVTPLKLDCTDVGFFDRLASSKSARANFGVKSR